MINVFSPIRYRDVAKEIAEGLKSGEVLLEEDITQDDLATLSLLLFRFVSPKKLAYTAAAAGVGLVGASPRLAIEIDPDEFKRMPERTKRELANHLSQMRKKGVVVDIRDTRGGPIES